MLIGGVPMSFEAITSITDAEAEAKYMISGAEAKARQMIEDAHSAGKLAVEAACRKAEDELAELNRQAGEKARAGAAQFSKDTESKREAMRAVAECKLPEAASLVVERIVNS